MFCYMSLSAFEIRDRRIQVSCSDCLVIRNDRSHREISLACNVHHVSLVYEIIMINFFCQPLTCVLQCFIPNMLG